MLYYLWVFDTLSYVSRESRGKRILSDDSVSLFPYVCSVSYVSTILLSYISYSLYLVSLVVLAELFLLYVSDLVLNQNALSQLTTYTQ